MTLIAQNQELRSFVHRSLRYVLALQTEIDTLRTHFSEDIDYIEFEYQEFDRAERCLPMRLYAPT